MCNLLPLIGLKRMKNTSAAIPLTKIMRKINEKIDITKIGEVQECVRTVATSRLNNGPLPGLLYIVLSPLFTRSPEDCVVGSQSPGVAFHN